MPRTPFSFAARQLQLIFAKNEITHHQKMSVLFDKFSVIDYLFILYYFISSVATEIVLVPNSILFI